MESVFVTDPPIDIYFKPLKQASTYFESFILPNGLRTSVIIIDAGRAITKGSTIAHSVPPSASESTPPKIALHIIRGFDSFRWMKNNQKMLTSVPVIKPA